MTGKLAVRDQDVLLVVDVQNDFCPEGRLAVPRGHEIVTLVNALAARFRHVVLTQDWHPPGHLSFASAHPGRKPYEPIEVSYGPTIACRERRAPNFAATCRSPTRSWSCARAITAISTRIRHSTRTTARPRPGLPGICANAASGASFWPGSRSTFASAIRARTPSARASTSS